MHQARGHERADEVADRGLYDSQGLVAVSLASHDDVGGYGGGQTASNDHAYQESGVHEGAVRGACADDAEDEGRRHQKALYLDKEVDLPARVVVDEHARRQRATGNEEHDGDAQVGDHGLFLCLMRRGDLDLGGYDDDDAHGQHEPLVQDKP